MSMELDDLLKKEGLDAAGIEDALAWARRRAAELVLDVDGDPELGPLLDGAKLVIAGEPAPPRALASPAAPLAPTKAEPPRPLFSDLRGLQAAFLAEGDEDEELPEVGAVLRAFQKGRSGPSRAAAPVEAKATVSPDASGEATATAAAPTATQDDAPAATRDEAVLAEAGSSPTASPAPAIAEPPAAASDEPDPTEGSTADADAHGVPAPPEADLDPLAGIDFDDLPGVDEDDEEEDHTHVDLPVLGRTAASEHLDSRVTMVPVDGPDLTLPSMQAPLAEVTLTQGRIDAALATGELTERTLNPLLPADVSGEVTVTAKAPNAPPGASPESVVMTDVTAPATVEPAAAASDEPAEAEAEEIELLDDEDLLLVEEEPEEDEVPEWKQALASTRVEGEKAKRAAAPAPDDEGDVDMGDD